MTAIKLHPPLLQRAAFIFFVVLSAIYLTGCFGLNLTYSTPKRAGKLPVFTIKDSLRGSNTPARSCYDVGFYELNLKTDIERHYISGNVLIIFRIVYQSDSIQIDLFPNLIIDSIVWKSRHLTFSRKYTAVFVKFPQQLKPGDKGRRNGLEKG
jgi:hypothetical protein